MMIETMRLKGSRYWHLWISDSQGHHKSGCGRHEDLLRDKLTSNPTPAEEMGEAPQKCVKCFPEGQ
jgi:hypothetical protein